MPTDDDKINSPEHDEPEEGPEFRVWNQITSGWEKAHDDMARQLDSDDMKLVVDIAKTLVGNKRRLILDDFASEWFAAFVADIEWPPGERSERIAKLAQYVVAKGESTLLDHPWIRHAVELEVAWDGISRASEALDRYRLLRTVVGGGKVPPKAQEYIAEVVQTFLFRFDAACIALCRATFEQIAREVLIEKKIYTRRQLKREGKTAGGLLLSLKGEHLISKSLSSAKDLIDRGGTVMHDYMYDRKIIQQQALDSIGDLCTVAVELLSG